MCYIDGQKNKYSIIIYVEVPTAVAVKNGVFYDITLCSGQEMTFTAVYGVISSPFSSS
jgi:hypothetical protein